MQLAIDAPSAGIHSAFIGSTDLAQAMLGQFVRIEYPVSDQVLQSLGVNSSTDMSFKLVLNVPSNAPGVYLFDDLAFSGFTCDDQVPGGRTGAGGTGAVPNETGGAPSGTAGAAGSVAGTGALPAATGGVNTGGAGEGGITVGGTGSAAALPTGGSSTGGQGGDALPPGAVRFTVELPAALRLSDVALGATSDLVINDGVRIQGARESGFAPVTNVGTGSFWVHSTTLGVDSHVDDVWSVGPTWLRSRSFVHGSIHSYEAVELQDATPTVEGETLVESFPTYTALDWWIVFQEIYDEAVIVIPSAAQDPNPHDLAPGRYGSLSIQSGGTLDVAPGAYFFDSLSLQPQGTLRLDNASGPAVLYVRDAFEYKGTLELTEPAAANVLIAFAGTSLYFEAPLVGTVVAPWAATSLISLPPERAHRGAVFGQTLGLHQWTVFEHVPFAANCGTLGSDQCDAVPTCEVEESELGTFCRDRLFAPECQPSCAGLECGSQNDDGCGGTCRGLCADEEPGCTSDEDCGVRSRCVVGIASLIGAPAGTGVCMPARCLGSTEGLACGAIGPTGCPLCVACVTDCSGQQCGPDPTCGNDCGTCGAGLACQGGHCVAQEYDRAASSTPPSAYENAPQVPGSTPGVFAVSDRGTASYSIPLELPVGRGGEAPTLSLDYDSEKGDGLLGVGWALGGLSAISLCPRPPKDGEIVDGVDLEGPDAFCLDGDRLALVSGEIGRDGGEYRTEVDRFSRIVAHASTFSGPDSFTVWTRGGAVLEYGSHPDARIYVSGDRRVARTWALNRATTRAGNVTTITYRQVNSGNLVGQWDGHSFDSPECTMDPTLCGTLGLYPIRVDYGAHQSGGVADRGVELIYEPRSDPLYGYFAGQRFERTQLLKRVDMKVQGVRVRTYGLEYLEIGERMHLSKLFECAPRSQNVDACKPPTTFEYHWLQGNFPEVVSTTFTEKPILTLDAFGVGRTDFFYEDASRDYWSRDAVLVRATGNRYQPYASTDIVLEYRSRYNTFHSSGVFAHHYRGVGLLRSKATAEDNFWAYNFWGSGDHLGSDAIALPKQYDDYFAVQPVKMADLDGDGRKDLVECIDQNGFQRLVWHRNTTTRQLSFWEPWSFADADLLPWPGSCAIFAANLDGDTRDELYHSPPTGTYWQFPENCRKLDLRSLENPAWLETALPSVVLKFADFNGDGLRDAVYRAGPSDRIEPLERRPLVVVVNTGNGFGGGIVLPVWMTTEEFDRVVAMDLDRDGRDELFPLVSNEEGPRFDPDGEPLTSDDWGLIRGIGSFSADGELSIRQHSPWLQFNIWDLDEAWVADVNGDGSSDLLFTDQSGALKVNYSPGPTVGKLARVVEGGGRYFAVEYGGAYTFTPPQGGAPDRVLPSMHGLVGTTHVGQVSEGPSRPEYLHERSATYSYSEARRDLPRQEWLGFASRRVVTRDGNANILSVEDTEFDQSAAVPVGPREPGATVYPLAGKPTRISRDVPNMASELMVSPVSHREVRELDWEIGESESGLPFAYLRHETATVLEIPVSPAGQGVPYAVSSRQRTFDVDSWGNTTGVVEAVFGAEQGGAAPEQLALTETTTTFPMPSGRVARWQLGLPERVATTDVAYGAFAGSETRTVEYAFDADAMLESVTVEPDDPAGAPHYCRRMAIVSRDSFRNPLRIQTGDCHGEGAPPRFVINGYSGNRLFPTDVTTAIGTYQVPRDLAHGGLLAEADPNGTTTTYTYDEFGRPAGVQAPDRSVTLTRERIARENNGRVEVFPTERQIIEVSSGERYVVDYDAFGRESRAVLQGFGGSQFVRETEYDRAGRVRRVSRFHPPGTYQEGFTEYEYDPSGRLARVILPDGATYEHHVSSAPNLRGDLAHWLPADGSAVAVRSTKNPRGYSSVEVVGAGGRVLRTIDARETTTDFKYGPFGALREIWPAETGVDGSWLSFAVDRLGRRTRTEDLNRGATLVTFNAFGEPSSITNARGETVTLEYDELGRLIQQDAPDGVSRWEFDASDDCPAARAGALIGVVGPAGDRECYSYDTMGRVTGVTHQVGGASYARSYGYDAAGRIGSTTTELPGVEPVALQFEYDPSGLLSRIAITDDPNQPLWRLLETDHGFAPLRERYSNGIETVHAYDPKTGRPTIIASEGTSAIAKRVYGYDANGNVNGIADGGPYSWSLTYDELDRLTSAVRPNDYTAPESFSYDYDERGDISWTGELDSFTYGDADDPAARPDALRAAGDLTFDYDGLGALAFRSGPDIPGGSQSFENDWRGQPRTVVLGTTGAERLELDYAASGVPLSRSHITSSGTATTTYPLSGVTARADGAGVAEYRVGVEAFGRQIAQITITETGRTVTFLHHDHLGSIRAGTNTDAAVVFYREYEPFGRQRLVDPRFDLVAAGFAGAQHDAELELDRMGARLYDTTVGRFISPDALAMPLSSQGIAAYSYAWNNPATWTDPTGLSSGVRIDAEVGPVLDADGSETYYGPGYLVWDSGAPESDVTYSQALDAGILYDGIPEVGLDGSVIASSPGETFTIEVGAVGDYAPATGTQGAAGTTTLAVVNRRGEPTEISARTLERAVKLVARNALREYGSDRELGGYVVEVDGRYVVRNVEQGAPCSGGACDVAPLKSMPVTETGSVAAVWHTHPNRYPDNPADPRRSDPQFSPADVMLWYNSDRYGAGGQRVAMILVAPARVHGRSGGILYRLTYDLRLRPAPSVLDVPDLIVSDQSRIGRVGGGRLMESRAESD